jgi:hypothetical protein
VPADVRTELAAAAAALELHGPAITNALRRLDQATTAAWNAVNPVDPTQDEWRLVERTVGIDRCCAFVCAGQSANTPAGVLSLAGVTASWRYDDYDKTDEDRSHWNKSGLSPRSLCEHDVFITVV